MSFLFLCHFSDNWNSWQERRTGRDVVVVKERRGVDPQLFLRDVCGAEWTFWWVDLVINQSCLFYVT